MKIECTQEEKRNLIHAICVAEKPACPFETCGRFECDKCMEERIEWVIVNKKIKGMMLPN